MTQLQMGVAVMLTSGAVAQGQMPGVEMSEEGRKAVGQFGKILMVCHHLSVLLDGQNWSS